MRTCISGCRPTRLRVEVSPSEAPTLIRPFAAEIEEHVSTKNIEYPASEHKNILLRCAYSGGPRDLGSGKKSDRLCRAAAVSLAVSLSSFAGLVPHAKGAVDQRAVDAAWMMFCCGSEGKGDTSEILVRWTGCWQLPNARVYLRCPRRMSQLTAHTRHDLGRGGSSALPPGGPVVVLVFEARPASFFSGVRDPPPGGSLYSFRRK